MTQATDILGASRPSHVRMVAVVAAAHFVSHYYTMLLAPLLIFVRADYGVTYTEIGFAFAAFNIVSAIFQTPAGFLVDRLGARVLLIGGLLIGAGAFIAAGLIDSFWVLVAMFGVAGLANTVYHPADYALLSHHVPAERIGQAFSVHTFAGMLGSAVAPATLLFMQAIWGWRGAFIGAGVLGIAVAAVLLSVRESAVDGAQPAAPRKTPETNETSWRVLLSAPIILNLVFFMLLALTSFGISNYSVVALAALHGTPVTTGNMALTANLLLTALGVLVGGLLVGRTQRHALVATLGLAACAVLTLLVGEINLAAPMLITVMALGGLANGVIMPSRDMIVRAVTPPGSFGRVFGFVTTGFNVGGIISPLVFGPIMDHGSPRLVFVLVAAFSLVSIATVMTRARRAA